MIPEQADGVPACKKLIERIQKGETEANFFEGMACNGGCVGGPKIIIKKEEGKERVDAYGDEAPVSYTHLDVYKRQDMVFLVFYRFAE